MADDEKALQLQQLANIVIDAYMNRDKQFIPTFKGKRWVTYCVRPQEGNDHPNLQLDYMYWQHDYESGKPS